MLKRIDEERLKFVRFWARYTRSTDPMVWSQQQKLLIDSVLENTNQDVEMYLRTKKLAKKLSTFKEEIITILNTDLASNGSAKL